MPARWRSHDPSSGPPDEPPPGRGRRFLRITVGCLLGAAAFLGIGVFIDKTGGT